MPETIPLPALPREIARLTGGTAPSYRRAYLAALEGRIPAERGENGRWTVARADLPALALTLTGRASQPAAMAA